MFIHSGEAVWCMFTPLFYLFFFFFSLHGPHLFSVSVFVLLLKSTVQLFRSNEKHSVLALKCRLIFNCFPKGCSNENLKSNETPEDLMWKAELFKRGSNIKALSSATQHFLCNTCAYMYDSQNITWQDLFCRISLIVALLISCQS